MTVIKEHYLHGKHNDESVDEDGVFIGERHIAVIDGVTSKSALDLWRPTPGVVSKNAVLHALATAEGGPTVGRTSAARGSLAAEEASTGTSTNASPNVSPNTSSNKKAAYASWPMRRLQHHIDGMLRAQYATKPKADADFFRLHPVERLQANAVVYSA